MAESAVKKSQSSQVEKAEAKKSSKAEQRKEALQGDLPVVRPGLDSPSQDALNPAFSAEGEEKANEERAEAEEKARKDAEKE